ncbi:4,5-dihydroxyphthalate decarboxylase [Bacillus sp. M6-12]|nr:4,5-dihydroxyphthalate decarboxylase [Bacillus sp. M6-12]
MEKLTLSFACADYDRIRALSIGTVKPTGINLIHLGLPVEEIFWRLTKNQEFDVSEMSFSSYLIAKERGLIDYTAIPVFPSRFFRHSCIFVNKHSGIKKPSDLIGKKVGVPEYQMTAALWIRGFLEHDYGVKARDISWFSGGMEQTGRHEKIKLDLPSDITVQPIQEHQTLNNMLEDGEIDAFITARAPSAFLNGSSNIERLFPHYVEVEKEYYLRTGYFPIMHLIVIRNAILEKHPWVANNLITAFEQSKQLVYDEYNQTAALSTSLPWQVNEVERTKSIMGEDFWPYGIEKNISTISAALQYSREQGLTKTEMSIEDLFVTSTLFSKFKI